MTSLILIAALSAPLSLIGLVMFLSAREGELFCFHALQEGGGCMGDGVDCTKCGLATYYCPCTWFYRLLGRVKEI